MLIWLIIITFWLSVAKIYKPIANKKQLAENKRRKKKMQIEILAIIKPNRTLKVRG
jgi:hypothetical protein